MRFEPGQKVVVRREGKWSLLGPPENSIVEVECKHCEMFGNTFIYLKGWTQQPYNDGQRIDFNECFFEPLMDITELTEILEQQPAEA